MMVAIIFFIYLKKAKQITDKSLPIESTRNLDSINGKVSNESGKRMISFGYLMNGGNERKNDSAAVRTAIE